ncbi:MAG: hypothetical protein PHD12_05390 [Methylotenera sp.]|nr:hypothetical protein [Methylotenera sp.]
MRTSLLLLSLISIASAPMAQAELLSEAQTGIKITLVKKPSTRPMTVAHIPGLKRYYIADGGLAPLGSETEAPYSKSLIHAYDDEGNYINSSQPGYDNRSIYYNINTHQLETITYNISSDLGFAPNSGIFSIHLTDSGELKSTSDEISQFNPAFGHASTMPSYDAENNLYYAKQARSNKVFVVNPKAREKVGEINLELDKAGAKVDDISDAFVAYTAVKGEEFALLDVDHKAILVFDITGKYIGRSELPKTLKLRANNYYSGLGYANEMLFVYHEPEGEFGTYYGFKFQKN